MQPKPRYQPGDKIGGRYQVHQALMGGMGEVYLCLDLEMIQPYALKTFQQRYLTNPKLRAAFEDEVATWVALEKHPNIVRCFLMDILDNQPFMILEWVASDESRGTDLRSWLRRGPLDLRLSLDFTIDICRGLIHANQKQRGIVHRDLKPENILVTQDRVAKITDFGLAKIVQEAELEVLEGDYELDRHQHLSNFGGTPPYMAPEQWLGEALDMRTDIYAVGCILYELLTGRWPFQGAKPELRRQHLEGPLPKLPQSQPSTVALDILLTRCLAKQREERFIDVTDLLTELGQIYLDTFDRPPKDIPPVDEFTAIDHNSRGGTYNYLQQYEAALADLNQAIQLDPTYAIAYNNRGNTYHDLQQYEAALADFNRAIQLEPNYPRAYNNRGATYRALGQHEAALADLNQAIWLEPNNTIAYYNRGLTYANLQQYGAALADLNQAIKLDPTYAAAYNNRGLTYRALRQYEAALADFNRAIQLETNYAKAYYNRGLTYANLRQYKTALVDLNRAIQLESNNAIAYNNRGLIYANLQRYKRALADFNQAIHLDPTCAAAYNNRGNTHDVMQQYEAALADYHRAIDLDPNHVNAYFNLGALFADHGQWREALPYFEKAAQLDYPGAAQYVAQARQMLRR